jgi:hypothetical protein
MPWKRPVFKETGAQTGYSGGKRLLGKALLSEEDFVSAKRSLSEALSVDRSKSPQSFPARNATRDLYRIFNGLRNIPHSVI